MHAARSLMAAAAVLLVSVVPAQAPTPAPAPIHEPSTVPASVTVPKAKAPVYDEAADARVAVKKAIAASARENRRVLIQWGANWCHWCTLLADTMQGDDDLSSKLRSEYDVVKVDVGKFDKHLDLAKELGAELKSIPFLTILGSDGKAIVQQNTEPFETKAEGKNGHDACKLLAFLTEHQAKPLEAATVRDAALAAAKEGGKRVFLHFGAPWCGWCHRLEDWMREPAVAALLAKDFVDLKIDTDRMTGGQAMLDAARKAAGVEGGGIPWIVFLDADGRQLVTSDGPDGNCGFPYEPKEIAWFGEMLKKARIALSESDVQALQDLLTARRKALEKAR